MRDYETEYGRVFYARYGWSPVVRPQPDGRFSIEWSRHLTKDEMDADIERMLAEIERGEAVKR